MNSDARQDRDFFITHMILSVFREFPWYTDEQFCSELNGLDFGSALIKGSFHISQIPALRDSFRRSCKNQSAFKNGREVLLVKEAWAFQVSLQQLESTGKLPTFDTLHKESTKLFGSRLTGLVLSKIHERVRQAAYHSKTSCSEVALLPNNPTPLENDMPAASTPSTTSMKKTSVKEADLENLSLTVMALEETVRKALAENESLKAQLVNVQNTLGKISEAQQKQAAAVVAPVTPPPQEAPRSNEMNFLREILAAGYEIRKAQ